MIDAVVIVIYKPLNLHDIKYNLSIIMFLSLFFLFCLLRFLIPPLSRVTINILSQFYLKDVVYPLRFNLFILLFLYIPFVNSLIPIFHVTRLKLQD